VRHFDAAAGNDEGVERCGGTRELVLHSKATAIDGFRLAGRIAGEPVHAEWDGRRLSLSGSLHQVAEIGVAVDDVFDLVVAVPSSDRAMLDGSPEGVMLTLLTCCDDVQQVEYSRNGRRRVIVP
jgi:hypothetical protein